MDSSSSVLSPDQGTAVVSTRMERNQESLDIVEPYAKEPTGNVHSKASPHDGTAARVGLRSRRGLGDYMHRLERQLIEYNIEARGIQRVAEEDRHALTWVSCLQVFLLWLSVNLAANNIALGMLGPGVYSLSFRDSALCSTLGALVGSTASAWSATWGPVSGNRTLVFGRYAMGWWPSKIIVLLNIVQMIGYCLIDSVVGGQILSAVSPGYSLSVAVGVVIIAVISWAVATFGIKYFHYYERFAFLPQLIVICVLFGVSAKHYDLSTPSAGDTRTVIGNRLSFFSICLSSAITYSPLAADFFVYYPPSTPKIVSFGLTVAGLSISFTIAYLAGIGLASGLTNNASYLEAWNAGEGALIVEGFRPVGGFGKFCSVVIALGLISNAIAPTYSTGIDFQILGRYAEKVPRIVWNTVGAIIYAVCALAGRSHLSYIFTNFLALMGYWVAIWFAILLEECYIFRRKSGYNWAAWNDRSKLPLGIAAFVAFLVGWVGAVLCMAQVWYIGPLAKLVGDYGADMGNYVGFSWAALVYPPLRYWELRRFGR